MAAFNAALNEPSAGIDVREGVFFEPVAGERFDLIATNPPFVISPATGERLVYRDSGLPGDQVVEHIVRAAPDHLTDRRLVPGAGQLGDRAGPAWDERLGGWLDGRCDALVVQREVVDPAEYVELWLKDAGHHGAADYARRYDTWLSWLDRPGRRGDRLRLDHPAPGRRRPRRHASWTGRTPSSSRSRRAVREPVAAAAASPADADLRRAARLGRRAPTCVQETVGQPGAEDPETIVLRQQRGLRRARPVDTVEAALVGACDGDLTSARSSSALAPAARPRPTPSCARRTCPSVPELVAEGFLDRPAWRRPVLARRRPVPATGPGRCHLGRFALPCSAVGPANPSALPGHNRGQRQEEPAVAHKLVIVESPAKARTIGGYLGNGLRRRVLHRPHPRPARRAPPTPRPRSRTSRGAGSRSTSTTTSSPTTWCRGTRRRTSPSSSRCSRTPTSSTSPPTRTARARRSPGTCSTSSSRRCRCTGWSSTRSPSRRSWPPSRTPASSTSTWSRPRRRAASSTGSTATRSRRCCGRRSCRASRPAACSPWRPGWSSTGSGSGCAFRVASYWDLEGTFDAGADHDAADVPGQAALGRRRPGRAGPGLRRRTASSSKQGVVHLDRAARRGAWSTRWPTRRSTCARSSPSPTAARRTRRSAPRRCSRRPPASSG